MIRCITISRLSVTGRLGLQDELGRDIEEMDAAIEKRGRWAGVVPGSLLKPRVGCGSGCIVEAAGRRLYRTWSWRKRQRFRKSRSREWECRMKQTGENMSVEELEDLKTRKEEESGYWWEMADSYGRQFVASPGANMLGRFQIRRVYNHALETATGLDNELKGH